MSQRLLDLFQKMIADLRANPRIEIVDLKWKPAAMNEAGIKYLRTFIEKTFKEPLPEPFLAAAEVSNNTHVCWRGEWNGKSCWGEFFLPSLLDLYREPPGGIQIEKSFGGRLKYSNKISVIDSHPEIGDTQSTLLDRASPDLPLWLHYKGRVYRLGLTYLRYLELLCTTRGIALWPAQFAADLGDSEDAPPIARRLAEMPDAIRYFFPDADLSIFDSKKKN